MIVVCHKVKGQGYQVTWSQRSWETQWCI